MLVIQNDVGFYFSSFFLSYHISNLPYEKNSNVIEYIFILSVVSAWAHKENLISSVVENYYMWLYSFFYTD